MDNCSAASRGRRSAPRPPGRPGLKRPVSATRGEGKAIDAEHITWIEIDTEALAQNLALFRRMAGEGRSDAATVMPVVKSNAYGHGLTAIVGALLERGVTWLGVNSIDEAVSVRELAPDARILVMGYVPPSRFAEAVSRAVDLTLTNPDEIARLDAVAAAVGRHARAHVKVETGTHRRGLGEEDHAEFVASAHAARHVDWVGLSTHFANIEDTINHDYAETQLARFHAVANALAEAGMRFDMRHVACTAAALIFPNTHMDLARVGIGLYGLWPSRETRLSYRNAATAPAELIPVLAWKARLTQVKIVPAGAFIGYGCTYRTQTESRIGVVPVGYHEGYPRALSNAAHMLVRGRRAPVRGRVCMNMAMVDLTHVEGAGVGDEVVIIGKQGDEAVTVDDLATIAGTINYEIVARLSPALPRVASSAPREPE